MTVTISGDIVMRSPDGSEKTLLADNAGVLSSGGRKHFALDANVISGTAHLAGTKTVNVTYLTGAGNQVSFSKAPRLTVVGLNPEVQNPYRVSHIKTGNLFTGFVLGFGTPTTGDIEWQALERG